MLAIFAFNTSKAITEDATVKIAINDLSHIGSVKAFKRFRNDFVEDMGFRKRVRKRPTDPVNSVLSLLYTFVMKCRSSLRADTGSEVRGFNGMTERCFFK